MLARTIAMAVTCLLSNAVVVAAPRTSLVVCAPGYPSDTVQAQPTMDDLARTVERAAGWSEGQVTAVYHPTVEGGLEALAEHAGLALTPLPFYLAYRERLGLEAVLNVVHAAGPDEIWSLVARRGSLAGPAALSGWDLVGMPGYSPRFVRRVALAEWGAMPDDVGIRFDGRVLSVLRKAARGEPVAALLDRAQADALGSLPFADELEVVARSRPVLASLLCRVGERVSGAHLNELKDAFLGLGSTDGGGLLLETLRIERFARLDAEQLARLERAFASSGPVAP